MGPSFVRVTVGGFLAVILLGALQSVETTTQPARTTLTRRFTPADQVKGRYQYIPFEVPPGTGTLRVMYRYDSANGDNIIDLGLFEPGPLDLGTRAFRGYSGGTKSTVILSPGETTPGYRPGPLAAGKWHVLLGLYKVQTTGVEVTVYIEAEDGPAARAPGLNVRRHAPPKPGPPRWYLGALHTHTLHSDGSLSAAQLMQLMRKSRVDFAAITDHNTITHQYELEPEYAVNPSPLWIIGEEVTTPGGHASVWGLARDEWVDFRVSPSERRIQELVATARRSGALFSVNHPASDCVGCGWAHEFADGIEGIEISNGRHGEMAKALAIWDRLLQAGRRITGVGSSDWHAQPAPLNDAHVRVYAAALSEDAILDAIRNGHVIVMRHTRDATPDITVRSGTKTARVGESLDVTPNAPLTIQVTAPGMVGARLVLVVNGKPEATATLDLTGDVRIERKAVPGYIRLELYGDDNLPRAIANPVYLVHK